MKCTGKFGEKFPDKLKFIATEVTKVNITSPSDFI